MNSSAHIIFEYLLRQYLTLEEKDRAALREVHGLSDKEITEMMWRGVPTPTLKLFIESDFARDFILEGVPGFQQDFEGRWRLMAPTNPGGLLLPDHTDDGRIGGLLYFSNAWDKRPRRVSSIRRAA